MGFHGFIQKILATGLLGKMDRGGSKSIRVKVWLKILFLQFT